MKAKLVRTQIARQAALQLLEQDRRTAQRARLSTAWPIEREPGPDRRQFTTRQSLARQPAQINFPSVHGKKVCDGVGS
jgi:hypothetical protein